MFEALIAGGLMALFMGMVRASAEEDPTPAPDPEPEPEPEVEPEAPEQEPDEEYDPYSDVFKEEVDDPEPEQEPEPEPEPEPEQPEEEVELTDEEIAAQIEGEDPILQPPNVDNEEWQAFQQWKQQQSMPQQQPVEQPQEQAPPPPTLELTQEEFDAAFESPEGFAKTLQRLESGVAARIQQQAQQAEQQRLQQTITYVDQYLTAHTFFRDNKDIDPSSKSTIKAMALIGAKHADKPLDEQLELVGEAVRGARTEAEKIKRSVHQPRVSRTTPIPKTGTRDQRQTPQEKQEDDALAFANMMTEYFNKED